MALRALIESATVVRARRRDGQRASTTVARGGLPAAAARVSGAVEECGEERSDDEKEYHTSRALYSAAVVRPTCKPARRWR